MVVTLGLDAGSQERFDDERRRYFPAGRTAVGAHVTLFHALPAKLRKGVEQVLAGVAGELDVPVTGLRSLGRGVAYELSCPQLEQQHHEWQGRWRDHLTRQDAQPLRLHVTVQNKVSPEEARATLAELQETFEPWTAQGTALHLWEYRGGPWNALGTFPLEPVCTTRPEPGETRS
jgi:hypothetical protein